MDVRKPDIESGDSLPSSDFVFRLVEKELVEKDKFTPKIRGFSLHDNDKKHGYGLSVDWSALTTPEESLGRWGASYKTGTTEFKDYKKRDIYVLNIGVLKSIDSILDVVYNPILNIPVIKGIPNNISHSLIKFDKNELEKNEAEIYTRIREHAKDKKVKSINFKKVEELIELYRSGD